MILRLLGLTGIGLFIVRDPRFLGSGRSGRIQQSGCIVRRTGSFHSSTAIWTGADRRSQRRRSITATVVMVLVVMKAATARGRRVTATAARIAHRRCQVLRLPSIIKCKINGPCKSKCASDHHNRKLKMRTTEVGLNIIFVFFHNLIRGAKRKMRDV